MIKRLFLGLIVSLFIVGSPVLAGDFSISFQEPDFILAGTSQDIPITITNDGDTGWFSTSVFPPEKWLSIKPEIAKVKSDESRDIILTAGPENDMLPLNYKFTVLVKKGTGEQERKDILLTIKQQVTAIHISDVSIGCDICEGDSQTITVSVRNVGTGTLSGAELIVNEERITIDDLEPRNVNENSFEFSIAGNSPGEYSIEIQLLFEGKELDSEIVYYQVPVIKDVKISKIVNPVLFGNEVTLKAENIGNDVDEASIESDVSRDWWVTYFGPVPDQKGAEWTWYATLNPNEEVGISYTEFYWPLPTFLVLIIVSVLYGYIFFTAVSIDKNVSGKGGREFGVSLRIKNKGAAVEGAVIRDLIPNKFFVSRKFSTLKPVMRKTARGTELLWRLGNIRPGEERVLQYHVKAHASVRGMYDLPAASINGKRNENNIVKVSRAVKTPDFGKAQSIQVGFAS